MFRLILVAVDGSAHAERAIAAAGEIARRFDSELLLLYAFPHVSDMHGQPEYERLLEARSVAGHQLLDAARIAAGPDVPAATQLIEGPPAQAILRVAAEERADLIVIGSRGHGQLGGLLLGSVSSVVAQRAACPVLIIH